ncbi:hypothetical protein [Dactylosporangium sp. NPDC000521]|uniref:hypothetical protein n=1 Tax=Dactylosporangium sp. NPDC000521 TaxID=3363975 RepID=UPI0036B64586
MSITRALRIAGVALAAAAATLVGPATAAHAFPVRTLNVQFSLFIHDQDGPDPDDTGTFPFTSGPMTVGPTAGVTTGGGFDLCVDEVRIKGEFTANLDVTGRVRTKTTMRLFEGASCATTDQDGGPVELFDAATDELPFTGEPHTLRVNNTDEYDHAEIVAMDCDFAILTQRLFVT